MEKELNVKRVIVLDVNGMQVSTTWANRALKLVMRNKAEVVCEEPLTIRLLTAIKDEIK